MEEVFVQLAGLLFVAFFVAYFVRALKQPLITGYIFAGIVASIFIAYGLAQFEQATSFIQTLSQLGIAFLLFMVGLHLNPKVIREMGLRALMIGLLQVVLTFGFAFLFSYEVLAYDFMSSLFIGLGISLSSTIIVTKILSDQRQIDSLYGKLSIGILIVQDLFAIAALVFIASFSRGETLITFASQTLLIGIGLVSGFMILGFFLLPGLVRKIARSQELLFLFSVTWCFFVGAIFNYFGFSIEIGSLIAGITLSISPYSVEISSKIKPIRDFFLVLFFVILGLNIQPSDLSEMLYVALGLSLFTLLIKPLIIMIILTLFSYSKRTNLFVGVTLSQVSEFSLILLSVGISLGLIGANAVSAITLSAVITIAISSYLITFLPTIYPKVSRYISAFERNKTITEEKREKITAKVIVFGYNRIGGRLIESIKKMKRDFIVVDFNPDTIHHLQKSHIPSVYGDASDSDFLDELPLNKIEFAVSTIPDFEVNALLLSKLRRENPEILTILRASSIEDALKLYRRGATYVLTPHFLGGEYISHMIAASGLDKDQYTHERIAHIAMLNDFAKKRFEYKP